MNNEIKEIIEMRDFLKGFYILKQDDKIIAKGHNLVVNTGRSFFYNKLLSNLNIVDTTVTELEYKDYEFYRFYAGEVQGESFMTLPETTFSTVSDHIIKDNNNDADERYYVDLSTRTSSNGSINFDITNRMIEIKLTELKGTSTPHCISEFFVTICDPDNADTTEVLFSRFLIDPIYLVSGSSYSLSYYITI